MAFWPTKYDTSQQRRGTTPAARRVVVPSHILPTLPTPASPDDAAAKPPRAIDEARTILRLNSLLRGAITPVRADSVLDLLEPHRPRLTPKPINPLAGMVGQPQGRMLEALLRPIGQIVTDVLLPGVRDHLIDRLVRNQTLHDASLPSAVDVADAMRALVERLRGGGRGHLVAVVHAMEADARATADRLTRDTAPIDEGGIDRLARALLRFEVRRMVLDALGATTALHETTYQARRLARFSLRRATEALDGFSTDRGLRALHASLATLAQADGLVVIAMRNLDDQSESKEESGPFVEPADRKAMTDWLGSVWRLSDTLFDLVGRAAAGGELDDLLFAAMLRQLRSLHHFCADLTHDDRPPTVDTLKDRLIARSLEVGQSLGDHLIASLLAQPPDRRKAERLLTRGRMTAQLLYDMEQDQAVEHLALRLLSAGDALGQNGPTGDSLAVGAIPEQPNATLAGNE
ncbi:hypothetical protein [Azospirillum griseum]|uniref:hypothetical protein n=1 Tax=Azospirillum griseum TaxID=2496639 RepID=UPI001AEC84AC|nr:hypothetical protein [Azospirillum griseum]